MWKYDDKDEREMKGVSRFQLTSFCAGFWCDKADATGLVETEWCFLQQRHFEVLVWKSSWRTEDEQERQIDSCILVT
jgi:hypothetical protein